MIIRHECEMETFREDGGSWITPCEVRMDGPSLVVSCQDDGRVVYAGAENRAGHYLLRSPDLRGRASLHRFTSGRVLAGGWSEPGNSGTLRIVLG